jgi:uncharacterized protein YbaA (DUF1428 family)
MPNATPKYVDGFVFVVPKKNVAAYKKMARDGAATWIKFGALEYFECVGDDLKTKGGQGMPAPLSFTTLTKQKPSETVWFSFIVFKNRKHRDTVNKKVMAFFDKKYANAKNVPMPFDVKRMAYGGFTTEIYKGR